MLSDDALALLDGAFLERLAPVFGNCHEVLLSARSPEAIGELAKPGSAFGDGNHGRLCVFPVNNIGDSDFSEAYQSISAELAWKASGHNLGELELGVAPVANLGIVPFAKHALCVDVGMDSDAPVGHFFLIYDDPVWGRHIPVSPGSLCRYSVKVYGPAGHARISLEFIDEKGEMIDHQAGDHLAYISHDKHIASEATVLTRAPMGAVAAICVLRVQLHWHQSALSDATVYFAEPIFAVGPLAAESIWRPQSFRSSAVLDTGGVGTDGLVRLGFNAPGDARFCLLDGCNHAVAIRTGPGPGPALGRPNARYRINLRKQWKPYGDVFRHFRLARHKKFRTRFDDLETGQEKGLVSIILPVYNGAQYIAEAIESVLRQSYENFELIIVDDGSTDESGKICQGFAERDRRIKLITQSNAGLPAALNRGFAEAKGEFHSWTSDDNRLLPDYLEKMVADITATTEFDVVYANQYLIDEEGKRLLDSKWCRAYQNPVGSPEIHMPSDTAMLNVYPNNYIGAAFLYRARIKEVIGRYDENLFGVEDYDFWMRANAFCNIRHTHFSEPVYEYRFHGKSLTLLDESGEILRLRERVMMLEAARRDYALGKSVWCLVTDGSAEAGKIAKDLRAAIVAADDVLLDPGELESMRLAPWSLPLVCCAIGDDFDDGRPDFGQPPPSRLVADICRVTAAGAARFAVEIRDSDQASEIYRDDILPDFECTDPKTLAATLNVRALHRQFAFMQAAAREAEDAAKDKRGIEVSVVICCHKLVDLLDSALRSVLAQSMEDSRYEVIVVNNSPLNEEFSRALDRTVEAAIAESPNKPAVATIDSPIPGLSDARNSGVAAARGRIVAMLDDDAVADENWLAELVRTYDENPDAGIVGGRIELQVPEPEPAAFSTARQGFWSHFPCTGEEPYRVHRREEVPWGANWSARRDTLNLIGGFRRSFGRVRDDFGGGEEIVAALSALSLGYTAFVNPKARVDHHVAPDRFTERHVRRTYLNGRINEERYRENLIIGPMSSVERKYVIRQRARLFLKYAKGWFSRSKLTRHQAYYGWYLVLGEWLVIRRRFMNRLRLRLHGERRTKDVD